LGAEEVVVHQEVIVVLIKVAVDSLQEVGLQEELLGEHQEEEVDFLGEEEDSFNKIFVLKIY
jgi:hypothetical protein